MNAIYCVTSQAIACRLLVEGVGPLFSLRSVRRLPTLVRTNAGTISDVTLLRYLVPTLVHDLRVHPVLRARQASRCTTRPRGSTSINVKRELALGQLASCVTRAPPDRARIAPTYHRGEPEPRPLKCAYGNHTTPRPARYQRWYLTTPTNVVSFSITHCVPTLVSTQQFHTPASHTFGPLGTCRQSPEVELVHELIQLGHQHVVDAGGGGQAVVVQYLLVCRVGYRVVR